MSAFVQLMKAVRMPTDASLLAQRRVAPAAVVRRALPKGRTTALLLDVANMQGAVEDVATFVEKWNRDAFRLTPHGDPPHEASHLLCVCAFIERGVEAAYANSIKSVVASSSDTLSPPATDLTSYYALPSVWREVRLDSNKDAADLQIAAYVSLAFASFSSSAPSSSSNTSGGVVSSCVVVTNDLRSIRGLAPLYPSTFLQRVPTDLGGLGDVLAAVHP